MSEISDGYHTFDELYRHRHALFLSLLKLHGGWAAAKHHDGTGYDGWFIAGTVVAGKQISYHMPDEYWPIVESMGLIVDKAPVWDGHTGSDVITRLIDFVRLES